MIKNSRHARVDGLICKNCGKEFSARKQRVDVGLGIFCSAKCASLYHAKETGKKYVGKENGKVSFDKTKNSYYVYWFDPDTLKRCTTSYARWCWEYYVGEIPEGYRASYGDGNPKNLDPDNIVLLSPKEFGESVSQRLMGHRLTTETKKKISVSHSGTGVRDGFADKSNYPNFSRQIKNKVRERDNYSCVVCHRSIQSNIDGRVHHIDGNKLYSVIENLVFVCLSCHALIHSQKDAPDDILAFRSMLQYG